MKMTKEKIEEIKQKKQKLNDLKIKLKKNFFGIDECIDKVVESLQTWYLMPEIITRPIIINLWGLTGVGKTSLIRAIVEEIGFSKKYIEIQMDSQSSSSFYSYKNICDILQNSSIKENEPGIILLDEFQRYRTYDEQRKETRLERFQDVWMLLSDGKFPKSFSLLSNLEEKLAMMNYNKFEEEEEDDEEDCFDVFDEISEEDLKEGVKKILKNVKSSKGSKEPYEIPLIKNKNKQKKKRYSIYPYEAAYYKKILSLSENIDEIMTWEPYTLRNKIENYIKNNKDSSMDYTKCLIFISGNLDEAYTMSQDVENCDTNADIFYEHTKKISIIDIKAALGKRFKPEQIARFGNYHIIYPSLSSDAYKKIIKKTCKTYTDLAKKVSNVQFTLSHSIFETIYENSVFPAQGTRPVFTSIHKMFGSHISEGVLWCLLKKIDKAVIDIDRKESQIIFYNRNKTTEFKKIKIDLDIDSRKNQDSKDFLAMVALHEAGHALTYSLLTKSCPKEVVINIASFKGGYVSYENKYDSKQSIIEQMKISWGGIAAEIIAFGDEARSSGGASDIRKITGLAASYVRFNAMSEEYKATIIDEDVYDTRLEDSSVFVNEICKRTKIETVELLQNNKKVLLDLAKEVYNKKKLNQLEYYHFIKKYIPDIKNENSSDMPHGYYDMLMGTET